MYSFKVSLGPTQLLSKCRLFESSPSFSLGFVLIGTRRSRNNNRAREKLATLRINLEAKNLLPELLKKLEIHQVESSSLKHHLIIRKVQPSEISVPFRTKEKRTKALVPYDGIGRRLF